MHEDGILSYFVAAPSGRPSPLSAAAGSLAAASADDQLRPSSSLFVSQQRDATPAVTLLGLTQVEAVVVLLAWLRSVKESALRSPPVPLTHLFVSILVDDSSPAGDGGLDGCSEMLSAVSLVLSGSYFAQLGLAECDGDTAALLEDAFPLRRPVVFFQDTRLPGCVVHVDMASVQDALLA